MKKLYLVFIAIVLIAYPVYAQMNKSIEKDSLFVSKSFVFKTKDNLEFKGIMTLPNHFDANSRIAILVTPPQRSDCNYRGMFSSLAKVLSQQGIATFRFDNRNFSDTTLIPDDDVVTMFDQAEDVHAAFEALRSDKRFKKNPIGLIGHSEGGTVSAIESSRNNNISFLITLSSCGIKGADFCYWQTTLPLNFSDRIPAEERNRIMANTYKVIQFFDRTENNSDLERKFREYITMSFKESKAEEVAMLVKYWLKPRQIAFLKHNPSDYFSKVSCPALIMHGMMDGVVEWKTNLDGIEKAFIRSDKMNYQIIALENINHAYEYTEVNLPYFTSVSRASNKIDYSEKIWSRIAKWITSLKD